MTKQQMIKRLELLKSNARVMRVNEKTIQAYMADTDAVLSVENIILRGVAAEIFVLNKALQK